MREKGMDEYFSAASYLKKKLGDKVQFDVVGFFDDDYKDALKLCGSKSGRDIDKAASTGLAPVFDKSSVYFEQAKLVIICKKIACSEMSDKNFIDKSINDCYSAGDFHTVYIGEIVSVLEK